MVLFTPAALKMLTSGHISVFATEFDQYGSALQAISLIHFMEAMRCRPAAG